MYVLTQSYEGTGSIWGVYDDPDDARAAFDRHAAELDIDDVTCVGRGCVGVNAKGIYLTLREGS